MQRTAFAIYNIKIYLLYHRVSALAPLSALGPKMQNILVYLKYHPAHWLLHKTDKYLAIRCPTFIEMPKCHWAGHETLPILIVNGAQLKFEMHFPQMHNYVQLFLAAVTTFLIIENQIWKSDRRIKQTYIAHGSNEPQIANGQIRVSITKIIIYFLICLLNYLKVAQFARAAC